MATATRISNRRRSRHWLLIAALAIALHLILLFSVKQGFFELFRKTIADDTGASGPRSAFPQAIIVVPVDVESDEAERELREPREEPRPEAVQELEVRGDADAISILDIVGEAQAPIPSEPGSSTAIVPPRPIEITWPETEKLGHCLGEHIDIRIRVDERGAILRVEPTDHDHPADCTQAAIDAAHRIRFRAGTVDGKPKAMWAQIRIEFRKQRR